MKAEEILVIGVKKSVIALERATGRRLWEADLGGGIGTGFVSVIADETRVFAHARGELFCLDLFSGRRLWEDGLPGYGYGLASLALPGRQMATPAPTAESKRQQDDSAAASTTTTTA